jgi:hypothetical protein
VRAANGGEKARLAGDPSGSVRDPAGSDGQTRSFPRRLRAGALAGVAVASLVLSACGATPSLATSGGSTPQNSGLAYSHCMRSHGVANFPDPDAQGNFPPFRSGVSKETSAAAGLACRHLLSSGEETPQGGREKLDFALRVAGCMHSHGFPTYPEPAVTGQGYGVSFTGTGIDAKSPQFQAAQAICEKQAQKADPKVGDG